MEAISHRLSWKSPFSRQTLYCIAYLLVPVSENCLSIQSINQSTNYFLTIMTSELAEAHTLMMYCTTRLLMQKLYNSCFSFVVLKKGHVEVILRTNTDVSICLIVIELMFYANQYTCAGPQNGRCRTTNETYEFKDGDMYICCFFNGRSNQPCTWHAAMPNMPGRINSIKT